MNDDDQDQDQDDDEELAAAAAAIDGIEDAEDAEPSERGQAIERLKSHFLEAAASKLTAEELEKLTAQLPSSPLDWASTYASVRAERPEPPEPKKATRLERALSAYELGTETAEQLEIVNRHLSGQNVGGARHANQPPRAGDTQPAPMSQKAFSRLEAGYGDGSNTDQQDAEYLRQAKARGSAVVR